MRKILPAIVVCLFNINVNAASVSWTGTWRQVNGGAGADAVLTLSHCDDKKCDFIFRSETSSPAGGGCTQYGQAEIGSSGISLIPSSGLMREAFQPNYYGCRVETKLQDGVMQISPFSKVCRNYCTDQEAFQGQLKKMSEIPLADRKKCITEKSPAWASWCQNEEFQIKDNELLQIVLKAEEKIHKEIEDNDKNFPESAIKDCDQSSNPKQCLTEKYEARKNYLIAQSEKASASAKKLDQDMKTPGDEKASDQMITQIEGVYKERFDNALVSGEKYKSENILEIVRVSKSAIYFKTHLDYFNGHECNLFGKATFSKTGQFTYQDKELAECKLTIATSGQDVVLNDSGTCKSFCGARGSLMDIHFPLAKKRTIKYMKRLKKSQDYLDSIQ